MGYFAPDLIGARAYFAPDVPPSVVTPPQTVGTIDAATVPASRRVVFEGSMRVVTFDGSDNEAGA